MPPPEIPWDEISTLFLDVGNTLISIDFERVAHEVSASGLVCSAPELRRAEAAARPAVSAWLETRSTEGEDGFRFFLGAALRALPGATELEEGELAVLVDELAPRLRTPGSSHRLWCWVLPGVPEALAGLRAEGLDLVVVSNSDGTVEQGLIEQGLRSFFSAVHDSHHVGFEKPDPRIFEHALAESGADASRTLHVGDLYAADVAGARAAGIHALLLDPFDDWGEVDCARLPDLAALHGRLAGRE